MLFKLQKQAVKEYLEENYTIKGRIKSIGDYDPVLEPSREYYLKLFTWDKGLYSGMLYSRNRVMDFILDFSQGSFQMGGISGKPLKNTVTNIRNLFPDIWQSTEETSKGADYEAFKLLEKIGKCLGFMGTDVNTSIGKGLFRALNYAPQIEQIVKVAPKLAKEIPSAGFVALMMYAKSIKPNETSLQKLLGLTKGQYKTLVSDDSRVNKYFRANCQGDHYLTTTIQYDYVCHSGKPNKLYINLLDEGDPQGETITDLHYMDVYRSKHKVELARESMLEQGKRVYDSLPEVLGTISGSKAKYFAGWLEEVDQERNYHEARQEAENLTTIYENIFLNPDGWGSQNAFAECLKVLDSDKQALKHLVKYLYASCYHQQAMQVDDAIRILRDYYRMVHVYPGFVKYPRFLKTAHDVALRNSRTKNTEEDRKKIMQTYQNYSGLEGKFGDWCNVVLASPSEIIGEGNAMHHCVGTYVKYVVGDTSLILSLRKADDPSIPVVTVELSKDKEDKFTVVNQAFGRFDASLTEEQNIALATFIKINHLSIKNHLGGTSPESLKDKATNNRSVFIDLAEVHAKAFADLDDIEQESWINEVKSA